MSIIAGAVLEPWISEGNILTMASMLVMVTVFVVTMRGSISVLSEKLSNQGTLLEQLADETNKIATVIVQQAVQNTRLDNIEQRMLAEGKRVDTSLERLTLIEREDLRRSRLMEK
jgi:hypothetical protein